MFDRGGLVKQNQGGFSLVEILVALVLIIAATAMALFAFNGNKSKGQILYGAMGSAADAMSRFNTDTSCYPTATGALFEKALAANTLCGVSAVSNWQGPYMKAEPLDANNNVLVRAIAPTATLTLVVDNNINGDGNTTQYAIKATNIPNEVAAQAYTACSTQTTNGAAAVSGDCVLSAPNTDGTGLTDFSYIFSESQ